MIYDISVPIRSGMAVWADEVPVELSPVSTIAKDGASVSRLVMSTHAGTHVDPPLHFIEGREAVDMLPLDVLVGPCILRRFDERFEITARHLEAASIPGGTTRLLLATP